MAVDARAEEFQHIEVFDKFALSSIALLNADLSGVQVVFLDIDMPEINGLDAAKALRGKYPELIIVFVTSYISCADRTEISKYLFALHLDEFVKIFDSRSRPKFENTSDNVAILNAFKARGWIYDYILDEAGYFKIRRHAPRLVSKTN